MWGVTYTEKKDRGRGATEAERDERRRAKGEVDAGAGDQTKVTDLLIGDP